MASNDLEVGAEALVQAGFDLNGKLESADSTPIEIASSSLMKKEPDTSFCILHWSVKKKRC